MARGGKRGKAGIYTVPKDKMACSMQIDYFEYLITISWPALCGLFLIYLFLGLRLIQAIKRTNAEKPTLGKRASILFRLILTISVLAIYTQMFVQSYGDWLEQPSINRGIVESIQLQPSMVQQEDYLLTLRSGEETITVRVDQNLYANLKENDLIEIQILPRKKEVFRCTVLTRQAENVI